MNIVKSALRGEEKLWKIFWLYAFIPLALVALAEWLAKSFFASSAFAAISLKLLLMSYEAFATYLVYKCAHNSRNPIYGRLALACMLFAVLWLLHTVIQRVFPPHPPARHHAEASPINSATITQPAAKAQAYNEQCRQQMRAYAEASHANPDVYISKNQSYLQQCTEYLARKNIGDGRR